MSGLMNEDKVPVKAILIGVAVSVAVMLILLCAICGLLVVMGAVPYRLLPYIALIADAGGAFCGTYIAAALHKGRGLILGLICGFILFVIHFFAGLCSGGSVGIATLLRFIVLIVFGILGGIAGVNKKEKLRIK